MRNDSTTRNPNAPFWTSYESYRSKGWLQTIPCIGKKPAVKGRHGRNRTRVSSLDLERWMRNPLLADANIGLGMPMLGDRECLIAFDLDDGSKHRAEGDGVETLRDLERRLCPLPGTWSNGHGDGPYRHLLFRAGFERFNAPGPGIDLITPWNRYIVAPPSIHPGTGETYEWRDPDGRVCDSPVPERLPRLPMEWEQYLTRGKHRPADAPVADMDPSKWNGIISTDETPCREMKRLADAWAHDPYMRCSCRHDGWLRLCRKALIAQANGHTGAITMLRHMVPAFADLISDRATENEARQESFRMYQWALTTVAPPEIRLDDPCILFGPPLPPPENTGVVGMERTRR